MTSKMFFFVLSAADVSWTRVRGDTRNTQKNTIAKRDKRQ